MAFQIIRNDITEVKADVIVNTANPEPVYAPGTDQAVYMAAGAEQLLAERKKIGAILPGQMAVTPAFQLKATYIFHTVGPVWEGGNSGEYDILADCYRNCLAKAAELQCESIAFPLIATGVYGFPKDRALQIAIGEITAFLAHHDMDVLLVVFDRDSFVLSGRVFHQVEELMEEKRIARKLRQEYEAGGYGERERTVRRIRAEKIDADSMPTVDLLLNADISEPLCPQNAESPKNVREIVGTPEQSFQDCLFRYIQQKGMKDADVYKRANLTRQHFSKIRSNAGYHPKKATVLALAMALQLNLEETRDLLESAGYALSRYATFDRLMRFFIEEGEYDIVREINPILFHYNLPLLGA